MSPAEIAVQLTVNDAGVAEPAAVKSVIAPQGVLLVTAVVREVSCVTAVPAPVPVKYPTRPVEVEANRLPPVTTLPLPMPVEVAAVPSVLAMTKPPVIEDAADVELTTARE